MGREIKIKISSGFDPSGVSAASSALDKMARDLEKSNKWLMQCNAELSAAIHKHASNVAVDMAAAADKAAKGMGNTYKSLGDFLKDVHRESQAAAEKLHELRARIQAARKAAEDSKASKSMRRFGDAAQDATRKMINLKTSISMLTQGTGFLGKALSAAFGGGIFTAAAAGVRLVIGVIKNAWEKQKEELENHRIAAVDNLSAMTDAVNGYKVAIEETANAERNAVNAASDARKSELELTERLTKATIELARQRKIAAGENAEVANAQADADNSQSSAKTKRAKADEEIRNAERNLDISRDARDRAQEEINRIRGALAQTREDWQYQDPEQKKAHVNLRRALFAKLSDATNALFSSDEQIKKDEAALEAAKKRRLAVEDEVEAAQLKVENEIAAKVDADIKKQDAEEKAAAEKRAEAEKKAAEKAAAERAKLDEKEAARRERERQKELADKIRDHQKYLSAAKQAESAAQSSVSAAESKLQQAWGWYRDKGSMAAQMAEEKADAAARKQYEKDFQRLKDRRRDWRTAENLSVDDEAVRRVALAREEKEKAERHLEEIEKNTADLAEKIDNLLQMKGG